MWSKTYVKMQNDKEWIMYAYYQLLVYVNCHINGHIKSFLFNDVILLYEKGTQPRRGFISKNVRLR